jgi:hypothetical protein
MFISEMLKARSRMRLAIGIIVLAAALGAVELWRSGAISNWVLTGFMVVAGLGALVRRQSEIGQVPPFDRPLRPRPESSACRLPTEFSIVGSRNSLDIRKAG